MALLARLIAKDLKRKTRAPLGFMAALAFPLVFSGLIALAFGRGDEVPKVRMLVDNEDGAFLGNALASAFTSQQAAKYFDGKTVGAAEGKKLMEAGKASAFLTIPANFTKDVLDGRPVTLSLLRNPAEGILPEIATQVTGTLADLLDGARRVLDKPLGQLRPLIRGDASPADTDVVQVTLAVKRALDSSGALLFPPAITLDSELFNGGTQVKAPAETKKNGDAPSLIFLTVLPGVAVYGLFLVADQGMRDVMTERTLGTLRRQLAGPVRPETIILGKAVYTAVLASVAITILALVGLTVLSVPVSFAGFVALSAALVIAVTGTTSIIYGLAKTERQASTFGNMIFLVMGFLGGGFLQVEALPPSVRAIAPFTPLYWGTKGYRELLEHHASLAGVAQPVLVLTAMGVVFLAAGAFALRRIARHGAAA
ncbi:MAG TPA: ABC transporter permease [Candidatus Polarisedimenticolaceae bacterium]|nr:ABC transporter permease [Candidatus Polarisedimenticolaceae bacterium]